MKLSSVLSYHQIPLSKVWLFSTEDIIKMHPDFYSDLKKLFPPEEQDPLQLAVDFELAHLKDPDWEQVVTLQGRLRSKSTTACIRCLEPMERNLDCELSGLWGIRFQARDEDGLYDDEIEIYFRGKVWNYFPLENNAKGHLTDLNLMLFFSSVIDEHWDHYPLHSENCQGLCGSCGTNLNFSEGKHTCSPVPLA